MVMSWFGWMCVFLTPATTSSPGVFSWGGAYHTVYWADPKEKLAAVLMTQLLPSGGSDLNDKFRVLVYQSIVGPPVTAPAHR